MSQIFKPSVHTYKVYHLIYHSNLLKGYVTVEGPLSELCSQFLTGGNSVFIAAIASDLFPKR